MVTASLHWRSALLSMALRIAKRSWRVSSINKERFDRLYQQKTPVMICFWHGKYIPIFPLMEGTNALVLTSQSTRGQVLMELCQRYGYRSIQIPDHFDIESVSLFQSALAGETLVGVAVDGPLGPQHKVKTGLIHLASQFGLTLLPVTVASRWHWTVNTRWDRMEYPLPFSRLSWVFGDPMPVPDALHNSDAHRLADELATRLLSLDQEAKTWLSPVSKL